MLLTLKALSSKVGNAALLIPFVRTKLNDKGKVVNPETNRSLTAVVDALVKTIRKAKKQESLQD
jgi:hypothetical protein